MTFNDTFRNKLTVEKTHLLANNVRQHVVDMTNSGKSSHVGSALSIVDILATLYGRILNIDPKNPTNSYRDFFLLSKGHAGAAVYATLAEVGFFDKSALKNHYKNGSNLSGHISHFGVPGVEFSTGSLGHALGVGSGLSLSLMLRKKQNHVYVLLSDGELDEGSNWEALLFAGHHKLSNLTAIIDYNKLQSLKSVSETLTIEPLASKFHSFNWEVFEVNGHDVAEIESSLLSARIVEKPSVIICNTVKGFGVSFMENSVLWHYRSPQDEEYTAAKKELAERLYGDNIA